MKKKDHHKEKITIDDIARMAMVSKTTVSRCLNGKYEYMSEETKQRIEKIIEKYQYKPSTVARSLKTKSTKLIGFVVSDIENAFAAPTINSMNQELIDTGYHMIIASSNNSIEQEKKLIISLIEQQVDAVLLNPVSFDASHLEDLNIEVPVILIDRALKDKSYDIISADSLGSMRKALEHLKQEGFTELYAFSEAYENVEPRFRRIQVFEEMLRNQGYSEEKIKDSINVIDHKNVSDVEERVKNIIQKTKGGVPAIIAINGRTLLALAIAIKNLGIRMPYEIGLIGYDDFGNNTAHGWTMLAQPPISSVTPNWDELGKKAIDLVIMRISNPKGLKKEILVEAPIKAKESTKLYKKYRLE